MSLHMNINVLLFSILVGMVALAGWTAFTVGWTQGTPLKSAGLLKKGVVWTVDLKKISARGNTIVIVSREHDGAIIEKFLNLGTSDHGIPGAGDQFIVLEDGTVKRTA